MNVSAKCPGCGCAKVCECETLQIALANMAKYGLALERISSYGRDPISVRIAREALGLTLDDAAEKPAACEMCGDAPCQGCNKCCGSKLGRDPEDGSCLGCG